MYRRWLLWLLVLLLVWLVIARFAQISELVRILGEGVWWLVLAATALQFAFYIIQAALYQVSFGAVLVHSRVRELVPVVFSAVFLNVALPTGGVSGAALFVDNAVRHGQSAARAAAGVLLVLAVDFSALAVLIGFGLAYLAGHGSLRVYELTASAILVAIIGSLAICFVLGLWSPTLLLLLLHWVQYAANWIGRLFGGPQLLSENWAARHAMDFSAASVAIAENPLRLSGAFAVSIVAHTINLASLYLLFLAFHWPVGLGLLIAGYAIGNLFWIVSITPQGVGVVEGMMTIVFTSLGVPVATAAAVVLAYRGIGFWLPLGVGFLLLRHVRTFREFEQREIAGNRMAE